MIGQLVTLKIIRFQVKSFGEAFYLLRLFGDLKNFSVALYRCVTVRFVAFCLASFLF